MGLWDELTEEQQRLLGFAGDGARERLMEDPVLFWKALVSHAGLQPTIALAKELAAEEQARVAALGAASQARADEIAAALAAVEGEP